MTMLRKADFVGIQYNPNMTPFDCLLVAAKIAQEKLISEARKNNSLLDQDLLESKRSLSNKRAREFSKLPQSFSKIYKPTVVKEKEGVKMPALKKIKITSSHTTLVESHAIRDMPLEFKTKVSEMGGTNAVLVIEKKLFKTDVNGGNNRFSVPLNQVVSEFLTLEEKEHLNSSTGKGAPEIEVFLIEPNCQSTSQINLRKWNMAKDNGTVNSTYVLVTTWNSIRMRNGLLAGNVVQLWAFRQEGSGKLCFAMVPVKPHD